MMRLLVCYCNTRSLSLSLSYAVALRVTKGVYSSTTNHTRHRASETDRVRRLYERKVKRNEG